MAVEGTDRKGQSVRRKRRVEQLDQARWCIRNSSGSGERAAAPVQSNTRRLPPAARRPPHLAEPRLVVLGLARRGVHHIEVLISQGTAEEKKRREGRSRWAAATMRCGPGRLQATGSPPRSQQRCIEVPGSPQAACGPDLNGLQVDRPHLFTALAAALYIDCPRLKAPDSHPPPCSCWSAISVCTLQPKEAARALLSCFRRPTRGKQRSAGLAWAQLANGHPAAATATASTALPIARVLPCSRLLAITTELWHDTTHVLYSGPHRSPYMSIGEPGQPGGDCSPRPPPPQPPSPPAPGLPSSLPPLPMERLPPLPPACSSASWLRRSQFSRVVSRQQRVTSVGTSIVCRVWGGAGRRRLKTGGHQKANMLQWPGVWAKHPSGWDQAPRAG